MIGFECSNCRPIYNILRRSFYKLVSLLTFIFIFSFLTLCSRIVLRNSYSIPSVAASVPVFVGGIIPGLFFKGSTKKFSGAKKEEMMGEIELAVKEYLRLEGTSTDTSAVPVNRQDIELTEYETV